MRRLQAPTPPCRLRMRRLAEGLTLQDLADRTGLAKTMLCMVERGYRSPSDETVRLLARYYRIAERTVRRDVGMGGRS